MACIFPDPPKLRLLIRHGESLESKSQVAARNTSKLGGGTMYLVCPAQKNNNSIEIVYLSEAMAKFENQTALVTGGAQVKFFVTAPARRIVP